MPRGRQPPEQEGTTMTTSSVWRPNCSTGGLERNRSSREPLKKVLNFRGRESESWRDMPERDKKNMPRNTKTSSSPWKTSIRIFTVYMCERLQGLPRWTNPKTPSACSETLPPGSLAHQPLLAHETSHQGASSFVTFQVLLTCNVMFLGFSVVVVSWITCHVCLLVITPSKSVLFSSYSESVCSSFLSLTCHSYQDQLTMLSESMLKERKECVIRDRAQNQVSHPLVHVNN